MFTILLFISNAWGANPSVRVSTNCDCSDGFIAKSCGTAPAFLSLKDNHVDHELGFDVPGDNVHMAGTVKGLALYVAFATFLEKSDRARLFYPEFFTKSAKKASTFTTKSSFIPKNATEVDEYFRCTIPTDRYCLYRKSLRPYLGLAAKSSGIAFSFLSCQAYVESRFDSNARSNVGASGYSQVQPSNLNYLNTVLHQSIRVSKNRKIASASLSKEARIGRAQREIATLWNSYWEGTKKTPTLVCKNDLKCYRHSFLVQALSLKADMLAFATSSSGVKADFDELGDFRIENLGKGDSLLLMAGSYNVGVTKMIRLVSQFCSGVNNLKDCLDRMKSGVTADGSKNRLKDVSAAENYILRIRDCSQQFSAEQIDFNNDQRWTEAIRTEKQDQQRDETVACLLHPCGSH